VLVLAACATAPPRSAPGGPEDRVAHGDLAEKNDEELFAIGSAARQAGDELRAALAFSRLADAFPGSGRARAALQGAGLAWRELERWERALPRFQQLAEHYRGDDADEAAFLMAEAMYHLGRHPEARAVFDRLSARNDLEPPLVARALTQRAVVELEDGEPETAERSLGLALSTWRSADPGRRMRGYYPGKAHFYLGEVYRSRLLEVKLDPAGDESVLAHQLERGSQLLLSAQAHYLDAIRTGEAGWAVAACARVGELYDGFYHQLVDAPLPRGLEGELERAYRHELRQTARVLVEKAVVAYEEALRVARRAGADTSFVPQAEESLERMRRLLAEGADE
jgi:tetratricopeptide (TPR) repeat protein